MGLVTAHASLCGMAYGPTGWSWPTGAEQDLP